MIVDVKKMQASGRDLSGPGCPAKIAAGRKDCRRDTAYHGSRRSTSCLGKKPDLYQIQLLCEQ